MKSAWGANQNTAVRRIAKNCYLVEFVNVADLHRAQAGGPWTYRGDMVASRQVFSHAELSADHIEYGEIGVQIYNIPFNSLNEEGFKLMGEAVGIPVSPPMEGFVHGRRFLKFKILVKIGEPLLDRVKVTHPTLGPIKLYCSYEKISRACSFCGLLGHEITGCHEHRRLSIILSQSAHQQRVSKERILAPKLGCWLLDPDKVPTEDEEAQNRGHRQKRSFAQSTFNEDQIASQMQGVIQLTDEEASQPNDNQNNLIKKPRPARREAPAMDR